MEAAQGVGFVRLQSCVRRGRYLAAEENGTGVCLRAGHRAASNIVWTVKAAAGADGEAGVLLRGAYGHYLVASNLPAATGPPGAVIAQQSAIADDSSPPRTFLWQFVRKDGSFVVRNLTGRFLRANGKYLRWRRSATVACDDGRLEGSIDEGTEERA
ncbi:hypothetical protein BAE44_0011889 [Dichanthelium oligosanthes]|uniref:DUF569 domain-containing protein n=1 Tax=Dichanthelium oligosanthes TaxID=888268 RepID=A0A1E5VPV1_9POAL|nr:hypothetical protein BAE44_0011889 [Dichanthelium oligosanthes]